MLFCNGNRQCTMDNSIFSCWRSNSNWNCVHNKMYTSTTSECTNTQHSIHIWLTKNFASFNECVELLAPTALPSAATVVVLPIVLLLRRLCADVIVCLPLLFSARLWLSRLEMLSLLLNMRSKCRSSTAAHDFRRPPLYQPKIPLRPGEWVDFVAAVVAVAIVGVVGTPPFDCVRSGSDKQIGVVPRFCEHAIHTETFSVVSLFEHEFRVKGALVKCFLRLQVHAMRIVRSALMWRSQPKPLQVPQFEYSPEYFANGLLCPLWCRIEKNDVRFLESERNCANNCYGCSPKILLYLELVAW